MNPGIFKITPIKIEKTKDSIIFISENIKTEIKKQDIESGDIELRNISYKYPDAEESVLENISAVLKENTATHALISIWSRRTGKYSWRSRAVRRRLMG